MRYLIATMVTTGLGLAMACPAAAQNSVKVGYVDLDLRSEAGIAALDRRLMRAASRACGVAKETQPARLVAAYRCRRDAIASSAGARAAVIAKSANVRVAAAPRP
jgi:UrcA family protein